MSKPKLLHYASELSRCVCCEKIFNTRFETVSIGTEEEFLSNVRAEKADAVVVCFCSAREQNVQALLHLTACAGPLPVLACSKTINLDFVRLAALKEVDRFLCCDMGVETIQPIISEAIRRGGLKEFLTSCYPDSFAVSPHVRKMIDEIIHAFPHRLHESEMAQCLGISRSWVQKLCRQAFGLTFTNLMRHIWVHQVLRLMQHTNLDNVEIAVQLNYSEESSLARDFRKELGYSPTEARKRLVEQSPEALLR